MDAKLCDPLLSNGGSKGRNGCKKAGSYAERLAALRKLQKKGDEALARGDAKLALQLFNNALASAPLDTPRDLILDIEAAAKEVPQEVPPPLALMQDKAASYRKSKSLSRHGDIGLDIVQFSTPIYFVEEEEGFLLIDIIRLGTMQGTCKAKWHTVDASARAGYRYVSAKGAVCFKDGEHTKTIKISIMQDDRWSTTTEFKLELENPENCELGLYLHHCRVKIIDNDVFPSNRFAAQVEEGKEGIESIPSMALMFEYFRLNATSEGLGWRTALCMILNQMHNIYLFLTLYVNVYLVDVLFNNDPAKESRLIVPSKNGTAMVIGVMYIMPMFVLHFWDYRKKLLDISGLSREFLQTNLFRKYLNYSEQSRLTAPPSLMQVAIVQDSTEVVEGYMAILSVVQSIGKLVILVYFILLENPSALIPVIIMPSCMLVFSYLRTNVLTSACEEAANKTAQLYAIVSEVSQKYNLVAEYMQRPQMCDLFHHVSKELSEAEAPAEVVKRNVNCNSEMYI